MKITLLGTGTPTPSPKRQSSGYLIDVGDDVIVMDHGPGAHHRLIETGRRAVQVTHVFFSHLHYDHCMDYGRLVLQRWDMGADRIPDLKVFGPEPEPAHHAHREPSAVLRPVPSSVVSFDQSLAVSLDASQ